MVEAGRGTTVLVWFVTSSVSVTADVFDNQMVHQANSNKRCLNGALNDEIILPVTHKKARKFYL